MFSIILPSRYLNTHTQHPQMEIIYKIIKVISTESPSLAIVASGKTVFNGKILRNLASSHAK